MESIAQAARDRGLFLHLGGGYLYGASGKQDLFVNHDWHYLSCDSDKKTSGQGFINTVTTTQVWRDTGAPTSPYHCFLLRPLTYSDGYRDDSIEYRTIYASNPPTNDQPTKGSFATGPGNMRIKALPGFQSNPLVTDLCAIPGAWEDKPNEVWLYLATGSRIVELELNEERNLENRGWQSRDAKSPVVRVRSVYPESVLNDPDGNIDAVFKSIDRPVDTLIHYGGMADSPDVFVVRHDNYVHEYVPTPWSQYQGIGVDEHYLWVFGTGGFACATHTSVIKAVNERAAGSQQSKPRWIEHYPNKVLYKGLPAGDGLVGPRAGEPELQGLRDLAPSDDGTLTANMWSRSYDRSGKFQGEEGPSMYTTNYEVNIVAGSIAVGNWAKINGSATQVHKQPVYCWPMFDSLKARLIAEGKQA